MSGLVKFDDKDLPSSVFDLCIDASTINTGNSKRGEHLKKDDFFHVGKYPSICFKSESIVKNGSTYAAIGKLNMRGIEKEVRISFTYKDHVLPGKLTLRRQDYGVGKSSLLVEDEVMLDNDR